MSVEEQVMQLPRLEKIRLMETLWTDLHSGGEEIESPEWHASALQETEQRYAAGREEALEWDEAKRRLRGV